MQYRLIIAVVLLLGMIGGAAAQTASTPVERGRYIFSVAGCQGCHTDPNSADQIGAGGRALRTPFGTFYGPNVTPHPERGIGRWSEADFIRAFREGVRPDGSHYFPVFPYASFTRMTDADLRDLRAFVATLPASDRPSRPHDVSFPFNVRFLQFFWKLLFFTRGPFQPDPARSASLNRGAYLAEAMAHCQECHTPRNFLGGLRSSMAYAGTNDGPEGRRVPNITPHAETGAGRYSAGELADLLRDGLTPDGDSLGGEMGEVVANSTGKMTAEDLRGLVEYLRSLRPIENRLRPASGS